MTDYFSQNNQLRTGPVSCPISVGYGLKWNDNLRYLENGKDAGFICTAQANIRAFWSATRNSTLSSGVGAGYQAYPKNSELNRAFLLPHSELASDITANELVFRAYDRFHYSRDVVSQGALSGAAEIPRPQNAAGLRARGLPDRYVIESGYEHLRRLRFKRPPASRHRVRLNAHQTSR